MDAPTKINMHPLGIGCCGAAVCTVRCSGAICPSTFISAWALPCPLSTSRCFSAVQSHQPPAIGCCSGHGYPFPAFRKRSRHRQTFIHIATPILAIEHLLQPHHRYRAACSPRTFFSRHALATIIIITVTKANIVSTTAVTPPYEFHMDEAEDDQNFCYTATCTNSSNSQAFIDFFSTLPAPSDSCTKLVYGMDCEWQPIWFRAHGQTERVCVIQFYSPYTNTAMVFSAVEYQKLPSLLEDFLGNENIIKVGVNVVGDASRIVRDFECTVRSVYNVARKGAIGGLNDMYHQGSSMESLVTLYCQPACKYYVNKNLQKVSVYQTGKLSFIGKSNQICVIRRCIKFRNILPSTMRQSTKKKMIVGMIKQPLLLG